MNRTEIKKAHKKFSPNNKTKIKRIITLNKEVCILDTRQPIKEAKIVFSLPCFNIQSVSISSCGKYLNSTQYCRNLEYLKNFVNYNLTK